MTLANGTALVDSNEHAAAFERNRPFLARLAYRMTGSLADADDLVQDAYLRWRRAPPGEVKDVRAFLGKIVTRLCLDHLKSARVHRETYVGPWLPESLVEPADGGWGGRNARDDAMIEKENISTAMMLALERMSPLERAAVILRDAFDVSFADIARWLEREEATCRQLAARGRAHLKAARPRFPASPDEAAALTQAFIDAVSTGDLNELKSRLAQNVVLRADGGGKALAARNPIFGQDRVARFFVGVFHKQGRAPPQKVDFVRIDGAPGAVLTTVADGRYTIALSIDGGRVAAVYIMRNPDKLGRMLQF